jgi:hypothetical protein
MLYAVLLYGALLTPILALPALLLMERLDRWATGAAPRSAGVGSFGAHPRRVRPPAVGRPPSPDSGRGFNQRREAPATQPGRRGSQRALTS